MAHVVDISKHLTNDKATLKIGDKEYKVNTNHRAVILAQTYHAPKKDKDGKLVELTNDENFKATEKALTLLLGEDAVKEINEMDIDLDGYMHVFGATMAAAAKQDYDPDAEDDDKGK